MKRITFILTICLWAVVLTWIAGQGPALDSLATSKPALGLIARHDGDRIILRWAPSSVEYWLEGQKYGYRVDRLRLDDKLEPAGEWDTLYMGLRKPYAVDEFKQRLKQHPDDKYLAIAAEGTYGYQLKLKDKGGASNPLAAAAEFKDRFWACLLAADFSATAADALGWRLEDRKIMPRGTYLYRVYVPAGDTVALKMDASIIVQYDEQEAIRRPVIEKAEELEGQVDLLLPRLYNEKSFTAFDIERSDDNGKTWHRLNEQPYVQPLTDQAIGNETYIVYSDTGLVNYQPHWYRVAGYTPFGDKSQPSDVIKAMARDRTPPALPDSMKVEMTAGQQMKVTWYYAHPSPDLKGFILGRSRRPFDNVQKVHDGLLGPRTRSYVDKSPSAINNNYYTLFVIDTAGNVAYSRSVFGAYKDEEPPAAPHHIRYEIDTNGIVKLTWPMGKEEDLMGYHVFFSNSKQQYPVNVTGKVLRDTVFYDTLDLKTLHEKVYYRITALDINYNVSPFSDWVEVVKPDLVPPTAPLIISHKGLDNGILFRVKKSHSRDVVRYELDRSTDGHNWHTVRQIPAAKMAGTITDDSAELVKGKLYRYRLRAVDDAGNKSKVAYVYTARTRLKRPTGSVSRFDVSVTQKKRVKLSWDYIGRDSDRVNLYRKNAAGQWILIKSVNAADRHAMDYTTKAGHTYTYQLKLLTHNDRVLDAAGPKAVKVVAK